LRDQLGGAGGGEAIGLAAELRLPVFVDEAAGRRVTAELGLEVFGSLRVLRLAKEAGRIERIAPTIRQIYAAQIYYSDPLLAKFLKEVGEG
jgi:predicted nucleic acid-binding protein